MKKTLKDLSQTAASSASRAITVVGDLNGDGRIDAADWEIARNRARALAEVVGDEAARLGKSVMRADMTRDVATGAAIGAAVAIPVPVVGPTTGAVLGAGVGLYKHLTKPSKSAGGEQPAQPQASIDDLSRLDDLRQRGILTEKEFNTQKRKLLRRF